MILYRDTKSHERITPPAWLEGAADLQSREDQDGRLWGIGDGRLIGPADKGWQDVGDGFQARLLKPFNPGLLARSPDWCRFHRATDLHGTLWAVPQILAQDGSTLAIQATYGPGWEIELTPLQAQADKASRWARHAISAAVEADAPLTVADGCQAAAEILSSVLHVSPQTLAALRLLDQGFVLTVLRTAAGWIAEEVVA